MKKFFRVILIVLACIVGVFVLIIAGFNAYLRISFSDFYSAAETHGNVPGIADGFIHQGLSYVPDDDVFISCGYMNDHSPSRIYVFDGESENYVSIMNMSGNYSTAHAGGLTYWNGYVMLTAGDHILVYNWSDVKTASLSHDSVSPVASFNVGLGAAFCYANENDLYVGEFYREQNYKTSESHHLVTPAGDAHHAFVVRFNLTELFENGFETAVPTAFYSVPDLAQGMCITDSGKFCISTSYAVAPSHIMVFDLSDAVSAEVDLASVSPEFDEPGTVVPLYYMDSSTIVDDIVFFPMSEELVSVDGRIYIINESASAKYIFGKLTGGNKIYSIVID